MVQTSSSSTALLEPRSSGKPPLSPAPPSSTTAPTSTHFSDAVRTLFQSDGASSSDFLDSIASQIQTCEGKITQVCRQSRLEVEGDLHGVIDAGEAIGGHLHAVEGARGAADAIHSQVSDQAGLLEERVHTRENLDAALTLVSQTRKFIRTYARIEDVIASRRLHTALKMLDRVDEEVAALYSARDADASRDILALLYPRASRLRDDIGSHARRILLAHLAESEACAGPVGKFALARVAAAVAARRAPGGDALVGKTPAWTPGVAVEGTQMRPVRAMSERRGRFARAQSDVGQQPSSLKGTTGRIEHIEPPRLYLRPLLQCVQVYADLGLFPELCGEYRRVREAQLKGLLGRHEPEGTVAAVEKTVETLAGFFVVERAVGMCVGIELLEDAVIVKEFWRMAYASVSSSLESVESNAGEKKVAVGEKVNKLRRLLDNFAETYGFPA